jgi:Leucine-rich repeat (LRR) protein
MKYLAQLTSLTELSISKNNISDEGVKAITGLTQLVYLDLTTNLITDEGVPSLAKFNKLTHLYLMSNRVTQVGVPQLFEALKNLEVLDIRFNINDNEVKDALKTSKPEKVQFFC